MPNFIHDAHAVFVKYRDSSHNIILINELLWKFNSLFSPNYFYVKLDIKKVFDSINHTFLFQTHLPFVHKLFYLR